MIDKSDRVFSFVDAALMHAQSRWKNHWLNKILQLVDWKSYSHDLDQLYSPTEGRPGWDPVVLFRCLLLYKTPDWRGAIRAKLRKIIHAAWSASRVFVGKANTASSTATSSTGW